MAGLANIGRKFFASLERVAAVRRFDGSHPKDPAVARMLGFGTMSHAGVKVNHDTVMALPAIYRAINILSNALSRVPFYVFKHDEDGNKTWAKGHTSWRSIVTSPHPEIKMVDFRRTMTSWAIGWGNAVAHINRPEWPNGTVEMTPLLPDRTFPVRITERMVKNYDIAENLIGTLYYQTRINDIEVAYPASDCLHIRGLGPNPYWGWDIVEVLIHALGGAQARQEFAQRFYGQGANPAGFITVPNGLSEEAEKRFVESISRTAEGLGKSHRFMALEEGAKFQQWTIDPDKAQFIEGQQFDYRLLANCIGIKVHKLIDGANSAYASLEQANAEHRDDDIFPWIMQWLGEYNDKLLTDDQIRRGTHVVDIDDEYVDGWVPFNERVKGVVDLHNNNLITRDEGRSRCNFGPSKDKNGTRYMSPMNIEFTDDKATLNKLAIQHSKNPPKPAPAPAPEPDPAPPDDAPSSGNQVAMITGASFGPPDDKTVVEIGAAVTSHAYEQAIDEGMVLLVQDQQRKLETLTNAWCQNVRTRLAKQAIKLAAKSDAGDFIAWVDGLNTEAAPDPIQAAVDAVYQQAKQRLTAIVDSPQTGLSDAVAAEVATWSDTTHDS